MQQAELERSDTTEAPERSFEDRTRDLQGAPEASKKKPHKYFEPTAFQFLIAVCVLGTALLASWEIARFPG